MHKREFSNLSNQTIPDPNTLEELQKRHPTAFHPLNRPLNRFRDVLPVEETRVKLQRNPEIRDYINANLVVWEMEGNRGKPIICCQAPLPTTFEDFWWMIWEQNSPLICTLNQKKQGDIYWPTKQQPKKIFGEIQVILESDYKLLDLDITVRRMTIKHVSGSSRELYQIHYYGWPDAGVPARSLSVRELVHIFCLYSEIGVQRGVTGPCVVHCLAGIGRTGTFLCILAVMKETSFTRMYRNPEFRLFLDNQKKLQEFPTPGYNVHLPTDTVLDNFISKFSIMDIVLSLRRQRNRGMVQTEDQYVFIYQALKDELKDPTAPSVAVKQLQRWESCNSTSGITWRRVSLKDVVVLAQENANDPAGITNVVSTESLSAHQEETNSPRISRKRSSACISSSTDVRNPSKLRRNSYQNSKEHEKLNFSLDEETKPFPSIQDSNERLPIGLDYTPEKLLEKYLLTSHRCLQILDFDSKISQPLENT